MIRPASPHELEKHFPLGSAVRLAALDVDPYPILARLRRHEPVTWVPEPRMWFVTRRDDVVEVLRDAETFTTESERSTIRDTFGLHMMTTDGDVALRYKRRCLHAFRQDFLAESMQPWVSARASGLVEDAAARASAEGSFDLVRDVASPLAVESALRVLGLPLDMKVQIAAWYVDFAAALANFTGDAEIRSRGRESARAFGKSVRPLLPSLARESTGLLGSLANESEDAFTSEEIIANALIILFGGIETTESMIANTVWALLAEDRWALAMDSGSGSRAMEEALRWQPAVQSITRHTTRDTDLRGVMIPAGSMVQCMIGGANRDPEHFTEPESFDPARPNAGDHLSFGTGRHLCLGAHLARIEIGVVLAELSSTFPTLAFAGGAKPEMRGYEFRRPVRMSLCAEASSIRA